MDGINGQSIQTLLRGKNDSKQSDEFQAMGGADHSGDGVNGAGENISIKVDG